MGQAYTDSAQLDEASDAFDKALATAKISPSVKAVAQAKKDEVSKRKAPGSKPAGTQ